MSMLTRNWLFLGQLGLQNRNEQVIFILKYDYEVALKTVLNHKDWKQNI